MRAPGGGPRSRERGKVLLGAQWEQWTQERGAGLAGINSFSHPEESEKKTTTEGYGMLHLGGYPNLPPATVAEPGFQLWETRLLIGLCTFGGNFFHPALHPNPAVLAMVLHWHCFLMPSDFLGQRGGFMLHHAALQALPSWSRSPQTPPTLGPHR